MTFVKIIFQYQTLKHNQNQGPIIACAKLVTLSLFSLPSNMSHGGSLNQQTDEHTDVTLAQRETQFVDQNTYNSAIRISL